MTLGDISRITTEVGHSDFHEIRVVKDQSYLEADPEDPRWLSLTTSKTGERRLLKKKANEDCHFLGDSGCTLPEATRPLVCRLYPFSFTAAGLAGQDDEYCPTELLKGYGKDMVEILQMSAETAETWRAQLYAELEEGAMN